MPHLHVKSGVLSPLCRFAFELRAIVARQPLPGYILALEHALGRDRLSFVMLAGGLAYSAGSLFFLLDRRRRFGHLVWHLFVIAGSGCHLGAVLHLAG